MCAKQYASDLSRCDTLTKASGFDFPLLSTTAIIMITKVSNYMHRGQDTLA